MAEEIRRWFQRAEVGTLCIHTEGEGGQNGYVASFDGRRRNDLLNREPSLNLREACVSEVGHGPPAGESRTPKRTIS